MLITIIIISLIAIWLIWSRYFSNKLIKKGFELVSKDNPVRVDVALREVMGYCERNHLDYRYIKSQEAIVIEMENEYGGVTIWGDGNFRLGSCVFSVD